MINKKGDRGFITVAVLWILLALASLIAIYSVYISSVAFSVSVDTDHVRADALTYAAIELTVYDAINTEDGKNRLRMKRGGCESREGFNDDVLGDAGRLRSSGARRR